MKIKRRLFFWLLAFIFLMTVPPIFFYAQGYRFSFKQGVFVYTGSISIISNPRNVAIYLNGKAVVKKKISFINNSYHIDGLRPGEYFLEIKAPGYQAWSKKIGIHSGMAFELWNIMLTQEEPTKEIYGVGALNKFFLSPNGKKIAFFNNTDDGELLVGILDAKTKEIKNIFSSREYQITDNGENIEWSPQSDKIIIPVRNATEDNYFIVDEQNNQTTKLSDVTKINGIHGARWDQERKNSLYFISNETLISFDLEENISETLYDGIGSFDLSSSQVYVFKLSDRLVYKVIQGNVDHGEQITKIPLGEADKQKYKITVYDKKRIAFLNKNGSLYLYNASTQREFFKKISTSAVGIQFSNDGKKLLYWSDLEILVHFIQEWIAQPYRQENESRSLVRFSSKISDVQWLESYEHIIFGNEGRLKLVELDYRDNINIMDIVDCSNEKPAAIADINNNKLYYIGVQEGKKDLTSIVFPETTGIFGFNF